MALKFATLSLFIIVLLHCTLANEQGYRKQRDEQNVCQIERLTAQEPQHKIKAEAGFTEYWDHNNQQLQCAGVSACRTVIHPKGLLLPQYTNSPSLFYVVQGRGVVGLLLSGCPETYQDSRQSSREGERGQEGQRFRDQHQKLRRFQQGDIIAIPAGVAHWCHNDGENDLILVGIEHTSNNQNQLDNFPRKFLLGGNVQQRQEQQREDQQGQGREQGQEHQGQGREQQGQEQEQGQGREQQGQEQEQQGSRQQNMGNVLRGISTRFWVEILGVDEETAKRLQGQNDERGHIVKVERDLQIIDPSRSRQQEEEQRGSKGKEENGLEETVCTSRHVHDISNPSRADFYNPRAGRINSVNSFDFPILRHIQLSAEHGVLYRNAIKAPHWTQNANKVSYVTRGEAQIQVVDQRGEAVFNERIREGQLVVVPQNFVAVIQASNKGFEYISFNTNDNAIFQTLQQSLQATPVDVLANVHQLSPEQAHKLKTNSQAFILIEPSQRSQRDVA